MILFVIYLALFVTLIYRNLAGNLFSDSDISARQMAGIFVLKALAVPVFYYLFEIMYGGIETLDAGKFFHDALVMNNLVYSHPMEFFKMIFGLQNDNPGSFFFNTAVLPTHNWDNGQLKDFFYNDNRIVIRIHALVNFFAFDSYFVHALFACFFSFIGSVLIYKSIKDHFRGAELPVLLIICFFPTLWLYTGSVLKEPYTVLVLGADLYWLKKLFEEGANPKRAGLLLFLLIISALLKPYILFSAFVYFSLYHIVRKYYPFKWKPLAFLTSVLVTAFLLNIGVAALKDKSFDEAALERKREFADMAKGGIFMMDSVKFIRLKYDYKLVNRIGKTEDSTFTLKKGVSFYYWEHSHQQDTLYCGFNKDTLTKFKLVYDIPEAGSNFDLGGEQSRVALAIKGLYYSILYPFFFNAKGILQLVSSFENLLLLCSLILFIAGIIAGIVHKKTDTLFAFALLFFALGLMMVIGITTPNAGALMRYRSPIAIFIILAGLYATLSFRSKRAAE